MQATLAAPQFAAVRCARVQRQSVKVQASARPQAAPQKAPVAAAVLALAAAVLINAAPASAADVKQVVCASNPTAKICLKNSGK